MHIIKDFFYNLQKQSPIDTLNTSINFKESSTYGSVLIICAETVAGFVPGGPALPVTVSPSSLSWSTNESTSRDFPPNFIAPGPAEVDFLESGIIY